MRTALNRPFAAWLLGLLLSLMLAACGGGGGGADAASRSTAVLAGDPASPALAALVNMAPEPAAATDIVNGLILTRLDVAIAADASVGQVNAALATVGGTIVAMRAGLPALTVAVPRQNGPEALQALASTLRAQPGIRAVLLGRAAGLDVAPPAPANAEAAINHLQQANFPAAWNARAAAGTCADKVTVIVADSYHRPIVLDSGFATQVPGVTDLGLGSVDPLSEQGFHGYDVLTTLAGKFDNRVPTGVNPFPECLNILALQMAGRTDLGRIVELDQALLGTTGKVIVNTSYGFGDACDDGDDATGPDACTKETLQAPRAVDRAISGAWQRRQLARDADSVLVASTAGNNADDKVAAAYPGTGQAEYNSAINVAATADSAMSFVSDITLWEPICPPVPATCLLPDLTATPDEIGTLAGVLFDLQIRFEPPAVNVLIVGSSDGLNSSRFSEPGDNVQAIGESVPTLGLGSTPERTQGTSVAAPQVAGLASYLWMLSPELRALPVQATMAAIKTNASSFPLGLIDAYATVLSLDQPVAVTPATAKIRLAILDVAGRVDANGNVIGDGKFDLIDLQAFHDAYVSGLVFNPTLRDYSRFDLNGDGFTGGSGATAMDLDPTGSVQFGARVLSEVFTQIGVDEVTLNEDAVTDAQALCFYANSGLLDSGTDLAARDTLLSDLCGPNNSSTQISGRVIVTVDGDNSFSDGTRNTMVGTFTFDMTVTVGANSNPTSTSGTIQADFVASEEGPGCSTTFAFIGSGAQPAVSRDPQGSWSLGGGVGGTITRNIVCTGGFRGTTVESFSFSVPNPVLGVEALGPNGALLGVTWNGAVAADVDIRVGANDVLVTATGRLN